jgi:thiamine-phosphate pyrophosphorylase
VTDVSLASPEPVTEVVRAALAGGARAIQLRAKGEPPQVLFELAGDLLALTRPAGALLFVNDRADVALAAGADGVHVGPEDIPVAALRRACPPAFLIGYSTDDPEAARRAEAEGASYIGCGAVWGTGTKDVGREAIGLARLQAVVDSVTIPVVAIGGITPERAGEIPATGAAGVAVVSAVMSAPDPASAVRRLLEPFGG